MKTKTASHTPGPWTMQLGSSGPRIYAARPDGRVSRDPLVVGVGGDDVNQSRANARLIAAAPDLLAACEALMSDCGAMIDAQTFRGTLRGETLKLARAAIDKATTPADLGRCPCGRVLPTEMDTTCHACQSDDD